ncbi:hypothetical protein T492DRAFT_1074536 [Pavlovales sp. CCMP2436]|nr:hypothetical protein T492DRAFT_1074536 [Pavlovales sp. CCMP2436]
MVMKRIKRIMIMIKIIMTMIIMMVAAKTEQSAAYYILNVAYAIKVIYYHTLHYIVIIKLYSYYPQLLDYSSYVMVIIITFSYIIIRYNLQHAHRTVVLYITCNVCDYIYIYY